MVIGGVEALRSDGNDIIHTGRKIARKDERTQSSAMVGTLLMPPVPVEQWVGNSFKVHERVPTLKTEDLHLAVVLRVIDDKQIHGIICTHMWPCVRFTWIKQ